MQEMQDLMQKAGSRTFEKVTDVLQLRYAVGAVAAVLLEQREHVVELAARVRLVQLAQLPAAIDRFDSIGFNR